MVTSAVRKLIPRGVREGLSSAEDFVRFELYANRVVAQRVRPQLASRTKPLCHLLVLGTPRSGTTIFGRLLNANPAIAGFGESRTDYNTPGDLERLTFRTAAMVEDFDPTETDWVFDKIVGPFDVNESVIDEPTLHFIFIARNPFAIYNSTVKLFGLPNTRQTAVDWAQEHSQRVDQLVATLDKDLGGRATWFTYEDLLEHSAATLAHLSDFMNLVEPLTDTFPATTDRARLKYGDPSGNAAAGQLVKPAVLVPEPDLEVFDDELVAFVEATHTHYLNVLRSSLGPRLLPT